MCASNCLLELDVSFLNDCEDSLMSGSWKSGREFAIHYAEIIFDAADGDMFRGF